MRPFLAGRKGPVCRRTDPRGSGAAPARSYPADAGRGACGTTLKTARSTYDAAGRPIQATSYAGRIPSYGYDRAGRLTSWTGPDGATTDYAWDDAGNRTKAGNETFVYDE